MFDVKDPEQAAKLALVLFAICVGIALIGFALSVHKNDGTILFIYSIEHLPPKIILLYYSCMKPSHHAVHFLVPCIKI